MQEFEQPQADRMTNDEAEKVIRLLAERRRLHEEAQSLPSVEDLAALANAEVSDVRDALASIRRQPPLHVEQKAVPARRVNGFIFVLALCVFCTFTFLFVALSSRQRRTIDVASAPALAPEPASKVKTAPDLTPAPTETNPARAAGS